MAMRRSKLHNDAITKGERVVITDDLIATGGTIAAAIKLIERLGGEIIECAFVIELPDLKGREAISDYNVFSCVFVRRRIIINFV